MGLFERCADPSCRGAINTLLDWPVLLISRITTLRRPIDGTIAVQAIVYSPVHSLSQRSAVPSIQGLGMRSPRS